MSPTNTMESRINHASDLAVSHSRYTRVGTQSKILEIAVVNLKFFYDFYEI